MARCKPCASPYDANDIPRHLPVGLTQYVLHAFATKSPPYHITTDDVSTPPILIDVAKIIGHQCVRGRGGAIAVLYETHWNGILRPTWERELDLQAFRHLILSYWANGPDHHQLNTRQYQQLRINAAAREIARAKNEHHLPGSYRLVTDDDYRARFLSAPPPIGASFWFHSFDGSWWLVKSKQPSNVLGRYVVRFLDNPSPALIDLPESAYNMALHAPCSSWSSPRPLWLLVPPNTRPHQPASRRLTWLLTSRLLSPPLPSRPRLRPTSRLLSPPLPSSPRLRPTSQLLSPPLPSSPRLRPTSRLLSSPLPSSPCLRPTSRLLSSPLPSSPRLRPTSRLLSSPLPSSPRLRPTPRLLSSPLRRSPWHRPLPRSPPPSLPHSLWEQPLRGLLCLHPGLLDLHRGLLCLHRGLLYLRRGLLYLHRGLLCLHREMLCLHPSPALCCCRSF